jgi:hypothetical protein
MSTGGFTEQGSRRAVYLEPGPVAVCAAEYTLDSGEMVRVPLALPLGPPATEGRITVTLPAPPGGGVIERADLLAEDGAAIFRLHPCVYVQDGDTLTWQIDASTF